MSLENLEPTFEPTLAPTMFRSLKTLALQHKKRLFATFGLVAAENLLLLIYPLVGSFAVNAVLNGQLVSALAYALMVLIIWGVAVWRNAHGFNPQTRCYRRAYLCGDYLSLDVRHQP